MLQYFPKGTVYIVTIQKKRKLHFADLVLRNVLKYPVEEIGYVTEIGRLMSSPTCTPWHVAINSHLNWNVNVIFMGVDP